MDVAADLHGRKELQQHGLVEEDRAGRGAEVSDLMLFQVHRSSRSSCAHCFTVQKECVSRVVTSWERKIKEAAANK